MATPHIRRSRSARILNATLWLAQILIFAAFTWAAFEKLVVPIPELATMWPWVAAVPPACVRALGLVDLAGGMGIPLPALTGIAPGATAAAALGCVALQLCAMAFHASRGEATVLPVNVAFLALAAFIAWGRLRPAEPLRRTPAGSLS